MKKCLKLPLSSVFPRREIFTLGVFWSVSCGVNLLCFRILSNISSCSFYFLFFLSWFKNRIRKWVTLGVDGVSWVVREIVESGVLNSTSHRNYMWKLCDVAFFYLFFFLSHSCLHLFYFPLTSLTMYTLLTMTKFTRSNDLSLPIHQKTTASVSRDSLVRWEGGISLLIVKFHKSYKISLYIYIWKLGQEDKAKTIVEYIDTGYHVQKNERNKFLAVLLNK